VIQDRKKAIFRQMADCRDFWPLSTLLFVAARNKNFQKKVTDLFTAGHGVVGGKEIVIKRALGGFVEFLGVEGFVGDAGSVPGGLGVTLNIDGASSAITKRSQHPP
jgi:hypothetical protein